MNLVGVKQYRYLFTKFPVNIQYPGKENALSRNRWEWINSHLEYQEKPLQDLLINTWQYHLHPGTLMTADETRIHSRKRDFERHNFNKWKPDKWAYESHSLHDTTTNYLYNYDLPKEYTAFQALDKLTDCLVTKKGKQKRHHVTADKHFSNVPQAELLINKGLMVTLNCQGGTKPKKLWEGGLSRGLPKGISRFARKGKLIAGAFHSKAKLHIVSNYFKAREIGKSGFHERRKLLQHYDDTKRGADKFNYLVKRFHNAHAHPDPARTILNGWIEWALTNGYILYKYNTAKPLTHRKYLWQIALYLLNGK